MQTGKCGDGKIGHNAQCHRQTDKQHCHANLRTVAKVNIDSSAHSTFKVERCSDNQIIFPNTKQHRTDHIRSAIYRFIQISNDTLRTILLFISSQHSAIIIHLTHAQETFQETYPRRDRNVFVWHAFYSARFFRVQVSCLHSLGVSSQPEHCSFILIRTMCSL